MDKPLSEAETRPMPPRPGPPSPGPTSPGEVRRDAAPSRRPLGRRLGWLVWLLILLAGGGAAAWWFHPWNRTTTAATGAPGGGRGGRRGGQDGPQPVREATITRGDIPVTLNALGTVTSLATVTVKTQINGVLVQIGFKEGQTVHKGDFLAQIDPRPYQIALENAEGALTRDQALLKDAQLDLARYQKLSSQDSIARQTVDTQQALVHQYQGTVQTDQSQIDSAKLNLLYCHIVAPVDGRAGLRQVDIGNYVQTSDANGLVIIAQMQPMSVIFTLPEDNLPQVLKRVHGGASLPVTAFDRSNTTRLATGTLDSIDSQIDTTTGTIKLRAAFANDDESLFPNQFVNARLLVDTVHDTAVVPSAAVQQGAPGNYVYLVKDDDTVTVRPVTLGPVDGDRIAVTKGLAAGDKVVIDGADRLKEGAKVVLAAAAPADAGTGAPHQHRHRTGQGGDDGQDKAGGDKSPDKAGGDPGKKPPPAEGQGASP